LAERCQIALLAAEGKNNLEIAAAVGVSRHDFSGSSKKSVGNLNV
jgi:DNA-binding CsgD family transcriptional regulator